MQDKICIHCVVSGHVQGVWYRASTQKEAERLGLTGWVRNLPGGEVEVMAAGENEQVIKLYQWLKEGPQLATVTAVTFKELEYVDFKSFNIAK